MSQGRDGKIKIWDFNSSMLNPLQEFYTGSYTFCTFAVSRWENKLYAADNPVSKDHFFEILQNSNDEDYNLGSPTTMDGAVVPPAEEDLKEELCLNKTSVESWTEDTQQHESTHLFFASPSEERSVVYIWDSRQNDPVMRLVPEDNPDSFGMPMSLVLLTPSSSTIAHSYVAAGYEGGQLTFYELRKGSLSFTSQLFKEPVLSVDVGKGNTKGVAGSSGDLLKGFKLDLQQQKIKVAHSFPLKNPGINRLLIREDQKIMLSAGWDHRIRIFNWKSFKELAILKYHQQSILAIDFCPLSCSGEFVSSSKDGRIAIWNLYQTSGVEDRKN